MIVGELWVDSSLVISGNITILPGSTVHVEGSIIHNGEVEAPDRCPA